MAVIDSTPSNDPDNSSAAGPAYYNATNVAYADDSNYSTSANFNSYAGGGAVKRGLIFTFPAAVLLEQFRIEGQYSPPYSSSGPSIFADGAPLSHTRTPPDGWNMLVTCTPPVVATTIKLLWWDLATNLRYIHWINVTELTFEGEFYDPEEPPPEPEPPILIPPDEPVVLFPKVRGTAWMEPE